MRNRSSIKDIIYVGIDNGVTGSIGAVNKDGSQTWFYETPVRLEQDFTKKKQNLNRLEVYEFETIIKSIVGHQLEDPSREWPPQLRIFIERPMINPTRFRATLSAVRCLEATLVALILVGDFRYEYVDSKLWQTLLLPKGTKGTAALKKASVQIGIRLFPAHAVLIKKHKDCDGLLLAEAMRRMKR